MNIRKDVNTGRFCQLGSQNKPGYRLGKAWFEVSSYTCKPPCACDGFEVCLTHLGRWENGGSWSSPVWPILSAPTEEDAKVLMADLLAFARTLDTGERAMNEHWSSEVNGDVRLAAWLTEKGFVKRSRVIWGQAEVSR